MTQIIDITPYIFTVMGTFATAFVGWFFGRKKTKHEVKALEIDNDVKLSKYYKELLEDLEHKYKERLANVEALFSAKEKALGEEIKILKRRIRLLENENKDLRKRNRELEKELKDKE